MGRDKLTFVGSTGRAAATSFVILAVTAISARAQGEAGDIGSRASLDTISITTREGTLLALDVSRDGGTIVFDLLGQLWSLDAGGGEASALTDAVRDTAEDGDPSLSPDGARILFSGERGGRRGLWLLDRAGGAPRLLSRTLDGEGFDGQGAWSPDGRTVAFTRAVVQVENGEASGWSEVALVDVGSGDIRSLRIEGPQERDVRDPAWSPDGARIAFVNAWARDGDGGRVWSVGAEGGTAAPLTPEGVSALAPAFSPEGERLAFLARDPAGHWQVWVTSTIPESAGEPRAVTDHRDVAPTRVRWSPDGEELLYSADGGLWRVPAAGGEAAPIPFVATLSIPRSRADLPPVRFPPPGIAQPARGHMGLALSPSGTRIGAIALGKLWVVPIGGEPPAFGEPRAVAEVSPTAHGLAWSSDEAEIAFAAGPLEHEDLYAADVATGGIRRVTALDGGEREPLWSPDGAHLAFVHATPEGFRLRVVDPQGPEVTDPAETADLGEISATWVGETADAPAWSPDSRALLVRLKPHPVLGTSAELVTLGGERRRLERFADAPIFLQWPAPDAIVFARHDRLWRAELDSIRGVVGEPVPLGDAPAMYPTIARDGTILYLSGDGWRLRSPSGDDRVLGWPLRYAPPQPAPLLIRNVRLVDGTGAPLSAPQDLLARDGRIARIEPAGGSWAAPENLEPDTNVLDAGGRVAIPGLMDLHMHSYEPAQLPGRLYYGVTTIRDQGSRIATLVATAEAIAAGVIPGPRVSYGGFQFFTDWPYDGEEWRGIEPEADPGHVERSVDLAVALGSHHVKTRTFRRWDINARIVEAAHRRGLRATGHCAHQLPLVAAGMNAQEHVGACTGRGDPVAYDDILQLYRASGIPVIPTVIYWDMTVRVARDGGIAPDGGLDPWEPIGGLDWMLGLPAEARAWWESGATASREMAGRFHRAGIRVGLGTDVWQVPWGVHLELEELVRAGFTPLEAIHAATRASADILGAGEELGTIEVGKWADLVLLDADPLVDIRNTGRIHAVVKGGEIVDRVAIRDLARTHGH
ncbi:MAG TPA: amidohydrolase family protein [Gemmatimonadota bacterium]|nr:amidohydrolase family protein [Gemmatimonadota bacterium]